MDINVLTKFVLQSNDSILYREVYNTHLNQDFK